MKNYKNLNRLNWEERVGIHVESKFYDLDTFRAGGTSLKSIELEELGDVSGKTLLHLQCQFGLDTLSWARRGAKVTGVDFSEEAITQAKALAREQNLNARFIVCDIYELPRHLRDEFDIVFTS
jgi:2-polyprenyl-3-methyl-5-hydroxy-6-metoxy-1,4-benzoquinol methylase